MKKHEESLRRVIDLLQLAGWRVVRLDRRIVPDAIAIANNKVVAIEIETNSSGLYCKRITYKDDTDYDEVLVFRPVKPKLLRDSKFFTQKEFDRAIELRKQRNAYTKIQSIMMKEFNRTPALGTLHKWFTGDLDESKFNRIKNQ